MKSLLLILFLSLAASCSDRGLQSMDHPDLGSSGHHDLATSDAGCPSDLYDAVGASCSVEGKSCGGPCTDPCQFCNIVQCQGGKWTQVESAPEPNCNTDAGSNTDASPDDCRTTGCQPGSYCSGCLTPTSVEYICIGNGAAC